MVHFDGQTKENMEKGKPVTTSVPSITIKFHANAEQIEELYDDENAATVSDASTASEGKIVTGDADTSPFKYLPRLGKRSTSIDVSGQTQSVESSSPPSDPWRFFSDIKGKITKSVEEKITEIKSRSQEEGSPSKQKLVKDSKENSSSVSDSEDVSESSISKTCGIVSTTEGVEMSSDDETPSLDADKRDEAKKKVHRKSPHVFSQRFRFLRHSGAKEGTVHVNSLSRLYNINTEKVEQALPEHTEEVESGVDALNDIESETIPEAHKIDNEEILRKVSEKIDNIELDDERVINFREVTGKEIRNSFFTTDSSSTIFAPSGFVDLRPAKSHKKIELKIRHYLLCSCFIACYAILHYYCPYLAGLMLGILFGALVHWCHIKLTSSADDLQAVRKVYKPEDCKQILEIPAVKEYQPLTKFEGWINEYPDVYSPDTYHISKTQSAFLRLQGNMLRISHTKQKIPKRAMYNEPKIKAHFVHHRIYNLLGAKVTLLPEGLAKIRHWSKKYPICITLSKDQLQQDQVLTKLESEEEKDEKDDVKSTPKEKTGFRFKKKDSAPVISQRFSKLTEEEDYDLESDSRASSPSPDFSDPVIEQVIADVLADNIKNDEELLNDFDVVSSNADSSVSHDDSPTEHHIYIFGRTDREKEDWFRRLTAATHCQNAQRVDVEDKPDDVKEEEELSDLERVYNEYNKYMQMFIKKVRWLTRTAHKIPKTKPKKPVKEKTSKEEQIEEPLDESKGDLVLWLNALIGRVLFDFMHDPGFTMKVRDRIQRKLSSIKLPYFIEELLVTELSLGKSSPMIHKAGKPILDEKGLWVDADLTYEGLIILTLQTKLNLMKLKNPQAKEKTLVKEKSAIFHSDVDDSAESSSDDEGPSEIQTDTTSTDAGNSGKKFIKMVDKIAESRFFQAATENRYIKKAMEGVSNTDLRLKVEMRSLIGTLVLNMPSPPSDRVWIGFRPVPEVVISAQPIVGERNITFLYVTSWIEKKLVQEFHKIMVIPNMEDFVIPVMNPKLPE
ncbi:testis-expressed protein 2 isoform X2 [Aethina tumida]|uniref:testis-expressed protein 2 isoform X2 n=1 Tax=Aethina tumida TaxID=116153 RepID=UPI002147A3CE|nr:testis-expressed protein 2 isoform X2 [Aethina tumida]